MMMVGRFHNDVVNVKKAFWIASLYLLISTHILVIFVLAHYSLYDTRAIKQKSFFGRFISLKECDRGGEGSKLEWESRPSEQARRAMTWILFSSSSLWHDYTKKEEKVILKLCRQIFRWYHHKNVFEGRKKNWEHDREK